MSPSLKASLVLDQKQLIFLRKLSGKKINYVRDIILSISRLGGYLNRKSDRPPGVIILVRGWRRFSDAYFLGYCVAMGEYG